MDKKLIVDIDNIEIKSKKSQVENSYDDLEKNIELLPKVLKLFKSIHVERLKIDGNEFTISLNDKAIYLDNKFINLSSKLEFLSNQVIFDLYSLYLKDVKLMFDGKVKIDYFKKKLDLFGQYFYEDIEGDVKLEMTPELAKFYANSEYFKSLKFIKKFVRLDSVAEEWMYDNVPGNIKLEEFYGEVDLENKKLLEKTLRGKAHINKAKIRFHKDAKIINTKRVDVNFKNDTLSFDLVEPVYDGIKMDGSKVIINHLTSEQNGEVVVDIKAKAKLDDRVLGILKAYEINLPLYQEEGITDANVVLKIPYLISKPMRTDGTFDVKNAKIRINDFEFLSKNANVILDGSIVRIKNSHFKIENLVDSTINLDIDTKTLKAKGDALINEFDIKTEDTKIVNLSGRKTNLELDLDDITTIEMPELFTNIIIADVVYVDILDLSKIYKSSQFLQDISVKGGNLSLKIKNENDLNFQGRVKGLQFPIERNGKVIDTLNIIGQIKGDDVKVSSKAKDINVEIKKKNLYINLNDLDVVIDTTKKGGEKIPDMFVEGKNVNLKIDDEIYSIVKANAKIKNEDIVFDGVVKDLDIPILHKGKKLEVLSVNGSFKKDLLKITTKDKKIKLKYDAKKRLDIDLFGYDLAYNTNANNDNEDIKELDLKAQNSNIIVNDKYKFLANNYEIRVREDSKFFHLAHKKTDITFKEDKNKKVDLLASDVSDEFVNSIFDKQILKGGKLLLLSNGTLDKLDGKVIITDVKIEDLAILNNLLIFIHSSPALVNPLLAIPSVVGMAANKGFSLTSYKVADGVAEFVYDNKKDLLDITKLVTVGNGIDFEGNGKVDIEKQTVDAKVKMIFFKDYSKIVGAIPVFNYVLLGDNKRVSTKVNIFGPLSNPKYTTNLTKDAFSVPLNIGKRIIKSPLKIFDIDDNTKKQKQKQKEIDILKQKLKEEENKNKQLKKELLKDEKK